MSNISSSPMMDNCLPLFKAAAAEVAEFELRLKLLANNHEINIKDTTLQKIAEELSDKFEKHLSHEDRKALKDGRFFRNKILHVNLNEVQKRLIAEGADITPDCVYSIDPKNGKTTPISEVKKFSVYGWMLECAASNTFKEVIDKTKNYNAMLDNLNSKILQDK